MNIHRNSNAREEHRKNLSNVSKVEEIKAENNWHGHSPSNEHILSPQEEKPRAMEPAGEYKPTERPMQPTSPAMQNMPNMQNMQNMQNAPTMPINPKMKIAPTMPATQTMPNAPVMPTTQNMPKAPTMPFTQNMPNTPVMPLAQDIQKAPTAPIMQNMPNAPTMPIMQNMPNAPTMPITQKMPPQQVLSKEELLRRLTAFDFMALDLQLFLDIHPTDRAALEKYNAIVTQADALRDMYQARYGPLYSFRSASNYPWEWINPPWPWNYEANFLLAGEE